jgi:hypothetical protein
MESMESMQSVFCLSYQERTSLILETLESEVYNGGFSQWVFNGYSPHIPLIKNLLAKIQLENQEKEYPKLYQALLLVIRAERVGIENNIENRTDDKTVEMIEEIYSEIDAEFYKLKNLEKEIKRYVKNIRNSNERII